MAHKALKMKCSHCDIYSSCKTCETDSTHYHWSDELAEMLKENSSKDISYRKRTKYCKKCENHFNTVEMREMDLENLNRLANKYKLGAEWYENALKYSNEDVRMQGEKIAEMQEKNQDLTEENQALIEKYQNLTDKIHKAIDMLAINNI